MNISEFRDSNSKVRVNVNYDNEDYRVYKVTIFDNKIILKFETLNPFITVTGALMPMIKYNQLYKLLKHYKGYRLFFKKNYNDKHIIGIRFSTKHQMFISSHQNKIDNVFQNDIRRI